MVLTRVLEQLQDVEERRARIPRREVCTLKEVEGFRMRKENEEDSSRELLASEGGVKIRC